MRGFSLLELMAVLAIMAVLSVLAMPAYRTYSVRARVADGFSMADELKTRVALFYQKNSRFPDPTRSADQGLGWQYTAGSATPSTSNYIYASSSNAYIKYGPTASTAAGTVAPIQIWYRAQTIGSTSDGVIVLLGQTNQSTIGTGSNTANNQDTTLTWRCTFYNSSSTTTAPVAPDIAYNLWPAECK